MKHIIKHVHISTIVESEPAAAGTVETETPANNGVNNPTQEAAPKLVQMKIYSSADLKSLDIKLCYLDSNREIDEGAVKKKIASIKKVHGVISPTLLVSAKKCLDEGLDLHLPDGSVVTGETQNIESYYVIVDGQHREESIKKINEKAAENEKLSNFYYVPLTGEENIVVVDLLREANVATFAWKDKQYLSNLLTMKANKVDFSLELLKAINEHPEGTTKALVHWFTLDGSRNLYSRSIVQASVDDEKLKEIASVAPGNFSMGKALFEIVSQKLGGGEAAKVVYPDWVIGKLGDDPYVSRADTGKLIAHFFKSHLDQSDFDKIKKFKADSKEKISRESKIIDYLDKKWNSLISKKPDPSKIKIDFTQTPTE